MTTMKALLRLTSATWRCKTVLDNACRSDTSGSKCAEGLSHRASPKGQRSNHAHFPLNRNDVSLDVFHSHAKAVGKPAFCLEIEFDLGILQRNVLSFMVEETVPRQSGALLVELLDVKK